MWGSGAPDVDDVEHEVLKPPFPVSNNVQFGTGKTQAVTVWLQAGHLQLAGVFGAARLV